MARAARIIKNLKSDIANARTHFGGYTGPAHVPSFIPAASIGVHARYQTWYIFMMENLKEVFGWENKNADGFIMSLKVN